jgi:RHS repeat-associated protein
MQRDRNRVRRKTAARARLSFALGLTVLTPLAVVFAPACGTHGTDSGGESPATPVTLSGRPSGVEAYSWTPPAPITTAGGGATTYSCNAYALPSYPNCTSTSPLLSAQCVVDYAIAHNANGALTIEVGSDSALMTVNPTYTTPDTEPCSYYFSWGVNAGVPQYSLLFYNNGIPGLWHASCLQLGIDTVSTNCSTGYIDSAGACVPAPSNVPIVQPGTSKPDDLTINGKTCPFGMCVPNATKLEAALQLNDIPVGYDPDKGPSARIHVSYNHLDTAQPATPAYGNLGTNGRWTHNFNSYIQDDPAFGTFGTLTSRYVAGGGQVNYPYETQGVVPGTYTFTPETQGGAVLSWTGSLYVLTSPDGSSQTFGQSDGAGSYPRKWFMTKETDPQGNYLTLAYDGSDRLKTITDAESRVTNFCYDPTRSNCSTYSGTSTLISQITDPFGRSAVFSYDSYGRLSSIQDVLGITSSFTYDGNPASGDAGADGGATSNDPYFISQLTTPYGNSTFVGGIDYSQDMRWLELTDADGYTERVEYDEKNSVIGATESSTPSGMTVENGQYNLYNTFYWDKYAYSLGYASGGTKDYTKAEITHWTMGNAGLPSPVPASTKAPLENRVYKTYPGQNSALPQLVGTYDQPAAIGRVMDDSSTQLSTFTYNAAGKLTETVDPLGRDTKYCYDSGCTTTNTNIDLLTVKQKTASSTYTTIAALTYTDSAITTSLHKPLKVTDAAGQNWLYCYNSAGQLTQTIDPANYVSGSACGSYGSVGTRYTYDGTGRLTTVTDALGNTAQTLAYSSTCTGGGGNNCDLPHTVTDSTGWTLTYARDALDRVTSITYPDASSTTDLYDYNFQSGTYSGTPSLEVRKHTDRLGRVAAYGYDADRRLTSVTDPLSHSVSYAYFADGTLHTMTDQIGDTTTWTIDGQSRPTSKTYPETLTVGYTYETTTSRLKVFTDEYSNTKTYAYDEANEPTGITYTAGDTPNVTYSYDTYFPRRTGMSDGNGSSTFTYVAIGTNGALNLLKEDGPFTHDDVTYAYDVDGRENSRTVGETTAETRTFDAIGRVATHTTDLGTFTYGSYLDETGLPGSRTLGSSSVTTTWGYGTTSNPMQLVSIGGAGSQARGYGLDYSIPSTSEKNPYTVTANQEAAGAVSGHPWGPNDWSYTYDALDRLTAASLPCSGGDAGSCLVPTAESFAYDQESNLTTYSNAGYTGGTLGYYGGSDFLQNSPTNGGYGYSTYSTGEFHESSTTRSNSWTGENHPDTLYYWNNYPTSYVQTQYWYDGLQRRVKQNYYDGASSIDTYYTWCRGHICARRDGGNTTKARYFPEGQSNNSGATVNSKWLTFKDESGNVRDTVDTSGNLVGAVDYTPYGSILRTSGTLPDYLFGGMMWDTNMLYNLSETRLYDPSMGRWWQRDPIGYAAGTNTYAYADSNPVSKFDPGGLAAEEEDETREDEERTEELLNPNIRGGLDFTPREEPYEPEQRTGGTCNSGASNVSYPPNEGFYRAQTIPVTVPVGTVVARRGGSDVSDYFTIPGTPSGDVSLPPGTASLSWRYFRTTQPWDGKIGLADPAYGQPGLGVQIKANSTLGQMMNNGTLEEIP